MITKKELDQIALSYHKNQSIDDKFIEDACQFYTYSWVFSSINDHEAVLELGFGEGNFTRELVNRNINVTVIDGSEILIKSAHDQFGYQIKTVCALFEEFEPEFKYDVIIATHVLEHVDDPVSLLMKMKNWLNFDGRIIIIVPNKESIHRQLATIMKLQDKLDSLSSRDLLVGHQRVYSFETLIHDIEKAGLQILEKKGFFLKVLPNSMMLDYSKDLINALNTISEKIPDHLLANIGVIVKN